MRHWVVIFISSVFIFMTSAASAETSKVAGAVVENMPSADVIKFVVSPVKANYDHKVICGNDSIRVRFHDIGLQSKEIKSLPLPKGTYLYKARIVPQMKNRSVLQIHPKGLTLDACARTSVMVMDGNLVVSMALTDAQKRHRAEVLGISAEPASKAAVANLETEQPEAHDTEVADNAPVHENAPVVSSSENNKGLTANNDSSEKDKFAGTIFDKSRKSAKQLKTEDEVDSQMVKYAGGMLFAAFIGFLAWYLKKKKNGLKAIEDNIDILSSKKVSTHQQLMVARVNGAKFLLAVGDKSVTSLGLIPAENDDEPSALGLQSQISKAVQESLAREPKISSTPYAEIEDDVTTDTIPSGQAASFGDDFRSAIEKIARERDHVDANRKKPAARKPQREMASVDRDMPSAEVPSNVSGLLSMARMRASFENRNTRQKDEFRA
ncbi:MAG: flagellar biosynthetic protein FliO [Deltaproteobacteria bacterium]|nr:flagellar biosynthetic protein FliO [Deltaproteobacteria bacterium]MBN2673066.1 flagellar biosynthetic protein FliO [Deltaproteobacteria bacterium]